MTKKQGVIQPVVSAFMLSKNWYLREQTPVQTVKCKRTRKYFALEEITREDGFRGEILVEKDYPFTPEYVSSFASSADYRTDPLGAVANAPKRRNLGDITQLQKALGLDFETARHLYSEFRAAVQCAAEKEGSPSDGKEGSPSDGKEGSPSDVK